MKRGIIDSASDSSKILVRMLEESHSIVSGARGSSMRWNPVDLDDDQLETILRAAL